jgi:thiamine pyrophosphate-dependent acetolactate synthase large subunit-like protein
MTKIVNGGEAILETLKLHNIKQIFGLLGGSMLELYDAIYQDDTVQYIGARDERAAAHMADACARLTGKPGIVLGAQSGPGVANLVTGVTEAFLAYSPLVAIAGMTTREHQGRDTFQEFDQISLFKSISKQSIMVPGADRLPEMLHDAIRLANSGRRGPVVLHVPRDLFAEEFNMPAFSEPCVVEGSGPTDQQISKIIALLNQSTAPVIFAGGGLKWAEGSESLQLLAEKLQIPVVASTGHADLMPHDHPLYAGQAGPRGNNVASGLTRDADLILAIGNRLAFNSTYHSHDYVSSTAYIVQIDIEARAIGRYFPVSLGIQGDAKVFTDSLLAAGPRVEGEWKEWREAFFRNKEVLQNERVIEATNSATPLLPTRVLGEIREALPREAIVTVDTGNVCLQAADRLAHYQCPSLIAPLDFGLVGFAYAAAIGAAAGGNGRPVFCIMGDGGFGFTMAEISTAVEYQLPVIVIVLDNGAWGAEKAYQKEFFDGRLLGAEINSPDYAEVAKLCGAEGYKVTNPGETVSALLKAIEQNKPAVIHVKTDPEALSALRKDLFKKK